MTIDLKGFAGFAIMQCDQSLEANKLYKLSAITEIPHIRVPSYQDAPYGFVPCGSVEWCQAALGKVIAPYYPPFQGHSKASSEPLSQPFS